MTIILGFLSVSMMFCLFGLIRNQAVFDYRTDILDAVLLAAEDDIRNHREWAWRLEAYRSVSYNNMMIRFWKPLKSFYPDMSFAQIGANK